MITHETTTSVDLTVESILAAIRAATAEAKTVADEAAKRGYVFHGRRVFSEQDLRGWIQLAASARLSRLSRRLATFRPLLARRTFRPLLARRTSPAANWHCRSDGSRAEGSRDVTGGDTETDEPQPCDRCGVAAGQPHQPADDDCALPHRYGRDRHPPQARHGAVCAGCVRRHTEWLGEIVDLYASLPEVIPVGSIPDDTAAHKRQRKPPASPALVRLDAWALLHDRRRLNAGVTDPERPGQMIPAYGGHNLPDIPTILTSWARASIEDGAPIHSTSITTVTGAAVQLRAVAEQIGAMPWVDEYDTELAWLRRVLRDAHGLSNPQPLGPCLTVSCPGRVWQVPGSRPRCSACGRRYGVHDIVRLWAQQRVTGH